MNTKSEGPGVRELFAKSLGVDVEQRRSVLQSAQQSVKDRAFAVSYWLQLFLAMGIATLGLVLDSTGVVIGAMLVAPLMGPIVQLAMGLAVASPRLALYSLARVVSSVLFVVLSAAIITGLLPFHETTKEILARTSPTALDLGVAAFCAVAAGYATVRSGADTAVTAAGTSIGISLVPPLCVVGFGLGVGQFQLSRGAALLFVANFSAILFFCTVFFLLLGFAPTRVADEQHSAWTTVRRGASRLALPLLLIAVVFVPLRRALLDVSREVAHRSAVAQVIGRNIAASDVVRSTVDVSVDAIRVQLLIVDHGADADRVRAAIAREIQQRTNVAPTVSVVMVADSAALRALSQREPEPPASPREVAQLRAKVADALEHNWPRSAAGDVRRWQIVLSRSGAATLHVAHDGAPLGAAAEELLAQRMTADLGSPTRVAGYSTRDESIVAAQADGDFLRALARMVARASLFSLVVCVDQPAVLATDAAAGDASVDASRPLLDSIDGALSVRAALGSLAADRWSLRRASDERWTVHLQEEPCSINPLVEPDVTAADATSER